MAMQILSPEVYCPHCREIYFPKSSKLECRGSEILPPAHFGGLDGAYFGTTFAHLFFLTYQQLAGRLISSESGARSRPRCQLPTPGSERFQEPDLRPVSSDLRLQDPQEREGEHAEVPCECRARELNRQCDRAQKSLPHYAGKAL